MPAGESLAGRVDADYMRCCFDVKGSGRAPMDSMRSTDRSNALFP